MTAFITEHTGLPVAGLVPARLASYSGSSLSTAPPLNANADYVRVLADAGMYFAISSISSAALSSTNAYRIAANAPPEYFGVPKGGTFYAIAGST